VAGFNEIQIGRLNSVLHKLLDMKEGAPAPSLSSDITAMLALEVDRPEWKFLGGEKLCVAPFLPTAVANNMGQGSLFNPVGSNVLCIIEDWVLTVQSTNTFTAEVRVDTSEIGGTLRSGQLMDGRWGTPNTVFPTCRVRDNATGVLVGGFLLANWRGSGSLATVSATRPPALPFILLPGLAYTVGYVQGVANANVFGYFRWRERAFEPSELR